MQRRKRRKLKRHLGSVYIGMDFSAEKQIVDRMKYPYNVYTINLALMGVTGVDAA